MPTPITQHVIKSQIGCSVPLKLVIRLEWTLKLYFIGLEKETGVHLHLELELDSNLGWLINLHLSLQSWPDLALSENAVSV